MLKQQLQERSKEVFDLSIRLKRFTDTQTIIERKDLVVQTELSFKNQKFTTTMDEIIERKLNK